MKHIIEKLSLMGWTKEFSCEYDARQELLSHICKDCLSGTRNYVGEDGKLTSCFDEDRAPDVWDIGSLLGTACGCEYDYEEIGDD